MPRIDATHMLGWPVWPVWFGCVVPGCICDLDVVVLDWFIATCLMWDGHGMSTDSHLFGLSVIVEGLWLLGPLVPLSRCLVALLLLTDWTHLPA